MSGTYEFDMRVVEKDREGYYFPRWDRAVPVTVQAANRDEAFKAAWAVMGTCPRRGWTWTAKIDRIRPVAAPDAVAGGA